MRINKEKLLVMKRVADIFLFIRIHKLVEYVGRNATKP